MTVPKGVKMPEDHKSPAQAEAEGIETFTIEFHGLDLAFPADFDDWPVESMLAFEEGRSAGALRGALGPKQWASLMAMNPLKRDINDLFEQLNEYMGAASGN